MKETAFLKEHKADGSCLLVFVVCSISCSKAVSSSAYAPIAPNKCTLLILAQCRVRSRHVSAVSSKAVIYRNSEKEIPAARVQRLNTPLPSPQTDLSASRYESGNTLVYYEPRSACRFLCDYALRHTAGEGRDRQRGRFEES